MYMSHFIFGMSLSILAIVILLHLLFSILYTGDMNAHYLECIVNIDSSNIHLCDYFKS